MGTVVRQQLIDWKDKQSLDDWTKYAKEEEKRNELVNDEIRTTWITQRRNDYHSRPGLISFIIHDYPIQISKHYINEQLRYIVAKLNENPTHTLYRIEKYLEEINELINSLNKVRKQRLEPVSDEVKRGVFDRAYNIWNNCAKYGNCSKLNEKVQVKYSKYIGNHVHCTLSEIKLAIKNWAAEILPPDKPTTHGLVWKQYKMDSSLFLLNDPTVIDNKSNNPTNNMEEREEHGPPTKRRKEIQKDKKGKQRQPCKFGLKCRYMLQNGKCNKYHPKKEFIALQKQYRAKQKENVLKTKDTNPKEINNVKNTKTNNVENKNNKCLRGKDCSYWQLGTCKYAHNPREMYCSNCRRPGHPKVACKKAGVANSKEFVTYNPKDKPNPDKAYKDINNSRYMQMMEQKFDKDMNTLLQPNKDNVNVEYNRSNNNNENYNDTQQRLYTLQRDITKKLSEYNTLTATSKRINKDF